MPQNINLNCYGIKVTLFDAKELEFLRPAGHTASPRVSKGGTIESKLQSGSPGNRYNAAIDGIESMILACACSGFDITDPKFIASIETAVDAIANNYGV